MYFSTTYLLIFWWCWKRWWGLFRTWLQYFSRLSFIVDLKKMIDLNLRVVSLRLTSGESCTLLSLGSTRSVGGEVPHPPQVWTSGTNFFCQHFDYFSTDPSPGEEGTQTTEDTKVEAEGGTESGTEQRWARPKQTQGLENLYCLKARPKQTQGL